MTDKIFHFIKDKNFPDVYEICTNTNVRKFIPSQKRTYENSYFLEEYKNQYKKTYYEDENFHRKIANERIQLICKFLKTNSKNLFEIGCASGFFLDEARKNGFEVQGIEISENEVRYAKSLGLSVDSGTFENFKPTKTFDVVCSFFVLEHFSDQEKILKIISSMVNKGGLFFVAIPSLNGPTFRTNPENWIETHPKDHFFDYEPKSFAKTMEKLGMKIVFQKPFSYHRSRDKGWKGKFLSDQIYKTLADWTCYGDTIQIIAKKQKS